MLRLITFLSFLVLGLYCYSQNAYYDARILKNHIDTITQDRIILKIDSANKDTLLQVISRYASSKDQKYFTNSLKKIDSLRKELKNDGLNDAEKEEIKTRQKDAYKDLNKRLRNSVSNSFIGITSQLKNTQTLTYDNTQENRNFSSVAKSIGSLNVTNFADGLAQFLIERANQELNIKFFQRFKDVLRENEEFQTVFPKTHAIFKVSEPYQYAANIHILKAAFKEDFANIVFNLEDLANLPKYQRLAAKDDRFKFIFLSLAAVTIAKKIKDGKHPADVLESLSSKDRKGYLHSTANNLLPTFQTISILSKSLRDTTADRAYIKWEDLKKNLFDYNDQVTFKIYLGLIYQEFANNDDGKGIIFYKENTKEALNDTSLQIKLHELMKKEEKMIDDLLVNYRNLGQSVNDIDDKIKEMRKIKDEGENPTYLAFYELISHSLETIENTAEVLSTLKLDSKIKKFDHIHQFNYSAKLSNEVFKNVNEKNYSLAVLNFSSVLDTLFKKYDPSAKFGEGKVKDGEEILKIANVNLEFSGKEDDKEKLKKIKEKLSEIDTIPNSIRKAKKEYLDTAAVELRSAKFLKYAAFMAAIAESESPESVKNAIQAAALPAGSASIKKNVNWNFSINAYLGASGGLEKVTEADMDEEFTSIGLWAPVGLAISKRIGKSSLSLFGSIIDVGAFASFRLKNGNEEVLPETDLANIFAPGMNLIWGIPKCPLSIGLGRQWGPRLRSFDPDDGGTIMPVVGKAAKWHLTMAFDIPLFNLLSSAR